MMYAETPGGGFVRSSPPLTPSQPPMQVAVMMVPTVPRDMAVEATADATLWQSPPSPSPQQQSPALAPTNRHLQQVSMHAQQMQQNLQQQPPQLQQLVLQLSQVQQLQQVLQQQMQHWQHMLPQQQQAERQSFPPPPARRVHPPAAVVNSWPAALPVQAPNAGPDQQMPMHLLPCAPVMAQALVLQVSYVMVQLGGGTDAALKALQPPEVEKVRFGDDVASEASVQDSMCVICQSDLEQGDEIDKVKGCGHVFHSCCFEPWLRRSSSCPICRKDVRGKCTSDNSSQHAGAPRLATLLTVNPLQAFPALIALPSHVAADHWQQATSSSSEGVEAPSDVAAPERQVSFGGISQGGLSASSASSSQHAIELPPLIRRSPRVRGQTTWVAEQRSRRRNNNSSDNSQAQQPEAEAAAAARAAARSLQRQRCEGQHRSQQQQQLQQQQQQQHPMPREQYTTSRKQYRQKGARQWHARQGRRCRMSASDACSSCGSEILPEFLHCPGCGLALREGARAAVHRQGW
eukprot:TRINITY_DN28837_c2_g1_i1.p1 TRINITY_DN28837_c2_g1~~TRINITY_DN28837_c2_g1_i1.p1  ORF type:complete len:518 (-),score=111.61 TRINITY_DN28837_c2_g1_i1:386-1939(-)